MSVPRYCSATQVPSCSDVGGPCEGWGGLRQRTSPVLSVSSALPVTPRQPPVLPVTPGQPTSTASPVSPTRKAPPVRPRQPSPPVPSSAPGVPTWAQGLLHSSQAATARPRAPPTPPSSTSPCPVGLGGPFLAPRVPSCRTAGLVSAGPGGRWGSTAALGGVPGVSRGSRGATWVAAQAGAAREVGGSPLQLPQVLCQGLQQLRHVHCLQPDTALGVLEGCHRSPPGGPETPSETPEMPQSFRTPSRPPEVPWTPQGTPRPLWSPKPPKSPRVTLDTSGNPPDPCGVSRAPQDSQPHLGLRRTTP